MRASDPVTEIIREMDRKPSALLSSCLSEVNNLRNSIILSERIICLAPLFYKQSFQSYLSDFPGGFRSFVFNPRDLPSFLGFAQMTQNTGFLICYLNERPDVLAKAVILKARHKNFHYLIRCAIPAIFGYFSSQEHLSIAIKFYNAIIDPEITKCDQKLAISILQPLMHSSINYRFIEAALSKFLDAFVVDVNFLQAEDKENYFSMYSAFLVRCICQCLCLLPEPILTLLHRLKEIGWDPENFSILFFQKFLWDVAFEWLDNSSAKNYIDLIKKIIFITSSDKNQISLIYKSLFNAKSVYEIPSVYTRFGHTYLDFFISVHDVHVIAKILHSCKMMPDTVTLEELMRVPPNYEFSWYTCQVYPHLLTNKGKINNPEDDPLFHGDTQEVKLFEKLLGNRLYKKELKKWHDLIKSSESMRIMHYISDGVQNSIGKPFMKSFTALQKSFNMPEMNRKIYLSLVEGHLNLWIDNSMKAILDHLDTQFTKRLASIQKRDNLIDFAQLSSRMSGALRPVLVGSVRQLVCIDAASLYDQFLILLKVMNDFNVIAKTNKFIDVMYPVLFQQGKGQHFLSTFIKLNHFAMKVPYFLCYCDDEERFLWLKLESIILSCLTSDEVFLKAYVSLQDQFTAASSRHIYCS
ncbi:hypothetical protein TRFO_05708 [Tritrichomonas foetus]|uniref:Uncharacterized protein n=1 Tax=Tritrichomonas foetus TaxID=1144522 RepID=A0A1J4K3N4_9EUKA|nr:hypothetical protein TRFO_05708 [Tritrichomonas foetus]|eukprot:OHT06057.1 hypothetical protein TRFO_05708 [Tritrichomonas foetus]